jgi:hypothetical protein
MRIPYRWWLIPVLLITTYLSARHLNADPLWVDEYWTIHLAGGSHEGPLTLAQVWERTATEDTFWPPGYLLLYSIWGKIVGWTPFAGRALSLLAGLLAIAWIYRLGSDLFTERTGLISAALMGTGAYFILFFHELRGYVLYVMLIAMTVWSYWQVVHHRGRWWRYLLLFFGSLGLLYASYFAALTLVTIGVYHLVFVPKNRQWWWVAITIILSGVLFLPWFSVVLDGLAFVSGDTVRQEFAFIPLQSAKGIFYMFSNGCIAVLAVFGIYSLRRQTSAYFAWFHGAGIFALLLIANARFGVVLEVRYLMPTWPALALIAGYGAELLLRDYRRPALMLIAVWMLAGVWNSIDPASIQQMHNPHWHLPWDDLVEQVEAHSQTDDALVFVLPDWTWSVYHAPVYNYYLHDIPLLRKTLMERPINVGYDNYVQQVQSLVTDDPMLWVGYTPAQPTLQLEIFRRLLAEQNYLHCAKVHDSPILQFDLYRPLHLQSQIAPVRFGDERIVLSALTASLPLEQRKIEVTQIWSVAADVPENTFSIGLHVDNAQGELVTQVDEGLPHEGQTCHWSAIDLAGLPSGNYSLWVVVYAWESGERLMALSGDSDNPVERLEVTSFTLP